MMEKFRFIKTIDSVGCLFFDDTKIFRGIREKHCEDVKKIFDICKKAGLFGRLIIDTRIVDNFNSFNFDLVLEHEKVDPVNYPSEWSPVMFFDCAKMVIEFMIELDSLGIGLSDCHHYNVLFHKGRFIWIDFGALSLNPIKHSAIWGVVDNFLHSVIMSRKVNFKKYSNIFKSGGRYDYKDIMGHLHFSELIKYYFYKKKLQLSLKRKRIKESLLIIKNWLHSYSVTMCDAEWLDHQKEPIGCFFQKELLHDKRSREIMSFISKVDPDRILCIGGNAGIYCFEAEKKGIYGIIIDIDIASIDNIYRKIKETCSKKIVPIVLDFLSPTPATFKSAPCDDDGCIELGGIVSAKRRFKSDFVLALALVHHLVFYQKVDFGEIIRQLKSFSQKYLIVEFVRPHDKHVSEWYKKGLEWYSMSNLKNELEKEFEILKTVDTFKDQRTLIFCKLRG